MTCTCTVHELLALSTDCPRTPHGRRTNNPQTVCGLADCPQFIWGLSMHTSQTVLSLECARPVHGLSTDSTDYPWFVHGLPIYPPRMCNRLSTDAPRTVHGRSTDVRQIVHPHPDGCSRDFRRRPTEAQGLSVDTPRTAGLSTDASRTVHTHLTDCPRTIHGHPTDYPQTLHAHHPMRTPPTAHGRPTDTP